MRIQTVSGQRGTDGIHCADAHGHLWVEPSNPGTPALNDERAASAEIADFAAAGGGLIVDCQPGGCGRNGTVLARLAASSNVAIVAPTGFHLERYYPHGSGVWATSEEAAGDLFEREVCDGLVEAPEVRAGVIKTAWASKGGQEDALMRAALEVARRTDTGVVVHTEAGAGVEELVRIVEDCRVSPGRIQLSHVDKRPEESLHCDLARAGYVLGYDTFLRPKYQPEHNVWRLLRAMLAEGLWKHITLGLDLVDVSMWHVSGGPGLRTLPLAVLPRLRDEGASEEAMQALAAGNIIRALGRVDEDEAG